MVKLLKFKWKESITIFMKEEI